MAYGLRFQAPQGFRNEPAVIALRFTTVLVAEGQAQDQYQTHVFRDENFEVVEACVGEETVLVHVGNLGVHNLVL